MTLFLLILLLIVWFIDRSTLIPTILGIYATYAALQFSVFGLGLYLLRDKDP